MTTPNTIKIDNVEYVRKGTPGHVMTKNYVIVRTVNAGVFAGTLECFNADKATMRLNQARRLWYWEGAASLSQLSQEGVKKPESCKFPMEVPTITLLGVIEVIPCSKIAQESIAAVPIWKA